MIVPLAQSHCPEVARLHLEHLRTGFRGRPGLELLAAYYAALVQSEGGGGFVAEQTGRVAGYVCGVWQPAAVRGTLLKERWLSLIFWGLAQALVRPRFFYDMARRRAGSSSGSKPAQLGYELRPIVVAPAARGAGLGALLVQVLLEDAARRGFDQVYLYAEEDNTAAGACYRQAGFRLAGQEMRSGEAYVRYEVDLPGR